MVFWSIVASIIFTVIILILTLVTIQQGYGYKHTIDPPVSKSDEDGEKMDKENNYS
ncbi:MAG TPA: YtzI protein [Pseudogracilibacillus sp.]|nr:YtzI protein [Pseudogracilibacillus sp.]